MDPSVVKAMVKWPNVPAVFGWLSLSRRGQWLLRGEAIAHQGAVDFIARNYQGDELGRWFFQNGPQRVFVDLEAAPLIFFVDAAERSLRSHCGQVVTTVQRFWLDERGDLYLTTPIGPGILYDQDLVTVLEWMHVPSGDDDALEAALDNPLAARQAGLYIDWLGNRYPVTGTTTAALPSLLQFVQNPRPTPSAGADDA